MGFDVPPFLVQSSYEWAISEQAFLVATSLCVYGFCCAPTADNRANNMVKNIMALAVEPCMWFCGRCRLVAERARAEGTAMGSVNADVSAKLLKTLKTRGCTNTNSDREHWLKVEYASSECGSSQMHLPSVAVPLFPQRRDHATSRAQPREHRS